MLYLPLIPKGLQFCDYNLYNKTVPLTLSDIIGKIREICSFWIVERNRKRVHLSGSSDDRLFHVLPLTRETCSWVRTGLIQRPETDPEEVFNRYSTVTLCRHDWSNWISSEIIEFINFDGRQSARLIRLLPNFGWEISSDPPPALGVRLIVFRPRIFIKVENRAIEVWFRLKIKYFSIIGIYHRNLL